MARAQGIARVTPAALILAGSRRLAGKGRVEPVAEAEGVSHKALIRIEGATLLERVVGAVRGAGLERIAVCADDPEVVALARALGAEVIAPASGPSASVGRAFDMLGAPLLVTTADHALLQSRWIGDFLADCPASADVALVMARRETVEAAMPGSRRTWLRFADGEWSGCNLFLLTSDRARAAIETWRMVEANRKRPWRIAMRLGLGTLIAYALRRLTLAEALARLGRRIGIAAGMVAARDGLAAVDVDKPSDLADVRLLLSRRRAA